MEVILLEKTNNLGDLGEQVTVKAGFGRNFLIPHGKAVPATKANIESFDARRAELEKAAAATLGEAEVRRDALADVSATIAAKAGEEGKLFGSIGTRDIAEAISAAGVAVEKKEVRLPGGALRTVGDFDIDVQLHNDIVVQVKLAIVAE